ncbi:migration and invasion-inhibitory protein-like [Carassius carassius]|uniref:migration and invasion-inhibitory protein-like n=1 Tax=Carassius carassius TaxID=217509 RepID=UPI0028684F3A|nr:migration and invasion-inhibitory protein-like [Carassius carassius]
MKSCWRLSVRLMLPKSAARTPCLLDAESCLEYNSEQFRQTSREGCVHSFLSGFPSVADLASSMLGSEEPQTPADTHQCTFCYRINSQPFAAPLDAQAACPVCKMTKSY